MKLNSNPTNLIQNNKKEIINQTKLSLLKNLGDRVCIIQGEIASGKSYVIFRKVLRKQLIIDQMNSDSSLSIFLNESILSNQLKENEYFELKEKFDKIKFIQELTVDFEPRVENFYN